MTHVTPLNNNRELAARLFPQESILYFPVIERPDGWLDKNGVWHRNDDYKHLIRVQDRQAYDMSVVGKNYQTLLNQDLFPVIEEDLTRVIEPQYLRDIDVNDKMSYNGRECFREYVFKRMECKLRDTVCAFRFIAWNSFGRGSVRLAAGAIDWACDNGVISGSAERHTRRHTSGLSVSGMARWLRQMIEQFWKNESRWREWERTDITEARVAAAFAQLTDRGVLSKNRARWLGNRIEIEAQERGKATLWEVYSAMTYWASHSDIRQTGNDHEAMTRVTRETEASKLMDQFVDEWKRVA